MSSTENKKRSSAKNSRLDPYFSKLGFEYDDCEHRTQEREAKSATQNAASFADAFQQRLRLNKLERELEDMKRQFNILKSQFEKEKQNTGFKIAPDVDPCIADLLIVTAELFPGECQAEVIHDPDEPDSPIVVFTVSFNGSGTALLEQRLAWHRRIAAIKPGSSGKIRISIMPNES